MDVFPTEETEGYRALVLEVIRRAVADATGDGVIFGTTAERIDNTRARIWIFEDEKDPPDDPAPFSFEWCVREIGGCATSIRTYVRNKHRIERRTGPRRDYPALTFLRRLDKVSTDTAHAVAEFRKRA